MQARLEQNKVESMVLSGLLLSVQQQAVEQKNIWIEF